MVVLVYRNGIGLDAAALFPVTSSLTSRTRFSLDLGLDANAYVSGFVPGVSGLKLYTLCPHVLAQYETRVSNKLIFLTEGSLSYAFSQGGSGLVYPGVRGGFNFRPSP